MIEAQMLGPRTRRRKPQRGLIFCGKNPTNVRSPASINPTNRAADVWWPAVSARHMLTWREFAASQVVYLMPSANKTACSAPVRRWSVTLIGVAVVSMSAVLSLANAQAPDRSALSSPVNHEVGRIEEVVSAADDGYRYTGYVLTWRSMRIVVAAPPGESRVSDDNLDIVVYRTEINGHRVLRFESNSASSNVADPESANSSASITLGTARIEDTISADSDGYRFVGYFVTWHDKRIFVVDPQAAPSRAIGETINFRVLRTGLGSSRRLSFSL
jgi:hypothetical protein